MRPGRWAMAIAISTLAACGTPVLRSPIVFAPESASSGTRAQSTAEELMAYLGRLRTLPEAGLAAEATRQRQLLQRDTTDLARVKAAMAVMLANPGDDAEALGLVEPIARRDGGDADVRSMASFLQALAGERRRQRESAAAANNRARDERRTAEAQKQRADALQERAAQLQQKLEALTEIERSLSDRQTPAR